MTLAERYTAALNKLCKWRSVYTGWHLGTRAMSDPQAAAMRDLYDKVLIMRAECNALAGLLIDKKLITDDEWMTRMITEAQALEKAYERQFPGFKATDQGMSVNTHIARDTMAGWKP